MTKYINSGEKTRVPPRGMGSNPGVDVIYGLSLLLVFVFAPRVFFRFSAICPIFKTNISNFQFDPVFKNHKLANFNPLTPKSA